MRLAWKSLTIGVAILIASLDGASAEAMSECSRTKTHSSRAAFKADAICAVTRTGDGSCQAAMDDAFQAEPCDHMACTESDSQGTH